jgi:hypothetical protein
MAILRLKKYAVQGIANLIIYVKHFIELGNLYHNFSFIFEIPQLSLIYN